MSLITTDITMDAVRPLRPNLGLSQRQAEKRLPQVGPKSPRELGALLLELLVLFVNPLVMVLLIAVLISIVVGQVTGAIIFVIAMLSVATNLIQTYRSERSVRRLRERVSLTASVLRDRNWQEIRREAVVPGIRTPGNPLKSRPVWLTANTLAVVAVGLALPRSPLAGLLGFTALPLPFSLFLGISTFTYLLLVEAAKRRFFAVSHHQATSLAEVAT